MRISDWSSDVCSSDLSALAFAAQGLLPLDPRDLEADASRMHATMWTLWWVALLPAAVLLAFGSRARGPSRALGAASVALALVIVLLALLPLDLLAPAVAQRVVFAAWLERKGGGSGKGGRVGVVLCGRRTRKKKT